MSIAIIVIGAIVLVITAFAIYRLVAVRRQNNKLNKERFDRIRSLYDKLESGQTITMQDVFPFAENLLTRAFAFTLLSDYNKIDLFPPEYLSLVKGAESSLANWLEFPTELDACPDEMEHIKRVTFDFDGQNNNVH